MLYRYRPTVVSAFKWYYGKKLPQWMGNDCRDQPAGSDRDSEWEAYIMFRDRAGRHLVAQENDWIVKGIRGEFHVYKPDLFEAMFEKVEK